MGYGHLFLREELGERKPKQNNSNGLWSPIPEGGVGRKKTKTESHLIYSVLVFFLPTPPSGIGDHGPFELFCFGFLSPNSSLRNR
jgi:hypothetical protein